MPLAAIVLTSILGFLEVGSSCMTDVHRRTPSSPPPAHPCAAEGVPTANPLHPTIADKISPDDETVYFIAISEPVELLTRTTYVIIMGSHDGLIHEDWVCYEHAACVFQ
jgi:hypothetical protein